jgi:hypothetical protein
MNSAEMTIFDIPGSVRSILFSQWVDAQSLVALDSACCNRTLRPTLYHAVTLPPDWAPDIETSNTKAFMKWAVSRGVKMRNVCLRGDVSDLALVSSFLKLTGACLQDLAFEGSIANFSPLCGLASQLCSRLLVLGLYKVPHIKDGCVQQLLTSCAPTLQELYLENVVIAGSCAVNCELPRLRLLLLHEARLGVKWLNSLVQRSRNLLSFHFKSSREDRPSCPPALAACTHLRNLAYYDVTETDLLVLLAVLKSCIRIEHLELKGRGYAIEQLPKEICQHCVNLQALALHSNYGVVTIIEARLGNLKHLSMDHIYCDNDMPLLTLAQHCRGLRSLALRGLSGDFTEGALVTLLSSLPALEELDLHHCERVSDSALAAVGTHCPHLRQLCMRDCGGYSVDGILAVAQRCRALKEVDHSNHTKSGLWEVICPGIVFSQYDPESRYWSTSLSMFRNCKE